MVKFLKWYRGARFALCPFPLHEGDVEEYLAYMKVSGVKPSGLSGFIEAIRFCEHVVGIAGAANCISVRAARQIEISDMNRSEKKQARILTVAEVENLEKLLMDGTEELVDRFAAGSM